jgi:hypothetical protein
MVFAGKERQHQKGGLEIRNATQPKKNFFATMPAKKINATEPRIRARRTLLFFSF